MKNPYLPGTSINSPEHDDAIMLNYTIVDAPKSAKEAQVVSQDNDRETERQTGRQTYVASARHRDRARDRQRQRQRQKV